MIERIGSKEEVRAAIAEARKEGRRIGFVPTMGALHDGHLSLVRTACARTDFVVVSIFVNPSQFGPNEDFSAYPRRVEADVALLGAEGVEIAFTPTTEVMYADEAQVTVDPGPLASRWEGAIRPGHFAGVATIVTKLFNIVRPDLAFFGEKDYQQLQIIKRLAVDLDTGVGVVSVPTMREPDGLALSSRNSFLDAEQRQQALALSRALDAGAAAAKRGEREVAKIEAAMYAALAEYGDDVVLDYLAVVDPATLEPLASLTGEARAIIAARIGNTRLIDNCRLVPIDV